MNIGNVIAAFRRKKEIDQKSMAGQLGISVSYLSQIENNDRIPSGKLLAKIAGIIGLPVSALLFEAMNENDYTDEKTRALFIKARPMMDKMIDFLLKDGKPQQAN